MPNRRFENSFAQSFMLGWKGMEDAEYKKALTNYYKSKGGGGGNGSIYGFTPKSEEEPSLLGRIFGGGNEEKPALSDVEQGLKTLQDVRGQAMRAGRFDVVDKIDAQLAKSKTLFGGKSGSPVKASPPANGGAVPAARPKEGQFQPEAAKPKTVDKISLEGENDAKMDEAVYKQDEENGDALQPQPAVLDSEDTPFSRPAVDDNEWVANGGMIRPIQHAFPGGPIQRASLGNSMDDEDGETAPYPPPPAEDEEKDPTLHYPEEDEDNFAADDEDHGLTTRLSQMAEPGVAGGLKYIAKASAQAGAIPDGSPNPVAQQLANNEGAASHEEVDAINKMVDPEGKLPPQARAAARISAVWEFYEKKDEPEKGAEMAARLMMYDKQNSQTRGMLAEQALKKGDVQTAAKLISDAHNEDLPSGDIMRANLTDDGSGSVKIIRANGSEEDTKVTPQQVTQAVRGTANGSEYVNWALNVASQHDARKGGKESSIDNPLFDELRRTKRAFARAMNSNDGSDESKANIQKYADKLDDIEEKVHDFAAKQKNPANVLKYYGVTEVPTSTLNPYGKKGTPANAPSNNGPKTAKEREAASAQAEIDGIQQRLKNADQLEEHGIEVDETGKAKTRREIGYQATDEEKAAAAKSILPLRRRLELQLAETAFDQADGRDEFRKGTSYADRVKEYESGLTSYLTKLNGKDKKPIEMDDNTKDEYKNIMDEIAKKNDTNPERMAKFIHGMVTGKDPMSIDRSTGRVVYGGEKFYVNRDALERISRLRGENAAREKDAAKKAGEKQGALDTVGSALTGAGNAIVNAPGMQAAPPSDKMWSDGEGSQPAEGPDITAIRDQIAKTNEELASVTSKINPDRKRERELRAQYDELRAKLRSARTPAVQ